jgi:hypothetical protein
LRSEIVMYYRILPNIPYIAESDNQRLEEAACRQLY